MAYEMYEVNFIDEKGNPKNIELKEAEGIIYDDKFTGFVSHEGDCLFGIKNENLIYYIMVGRNERNK